VRRSLSALLLLLLVILGVIGYYLFVPAGPRHEVFVEIPPGTGTGQIARQLKRQGVISSRFTFLALRLFERGRLKAGEYRFDHPANVFEVYERIRHGDIYYRSIIVPEGYNLFDIAAAVEAAHLATRQQFLVAARQNVSLISDLDSQAQTLEGYLFPDTYRFQRLDSPEIILATMVRRFRAAALQAGLHSDCHHIVTLASLVEKETPVADDRPLVASVLDNRLARNMPLMTDPTVIYAAMLDNAFRGTIHRSDLQRDSDYNTYRHTGLPPGPICEPGLAALEAAMHPAHTDYLYFVADPSATGHSRFATTLQQHERNVAAYRSAERASQPAR
jgi:UPF0755 protein